MIDKTERVFSQELMEAIAVMPVVDTHEHLIPETMRTQSNADFFNIIMSQYASSDLVSAGLPVYGMEKLRDTETPFSEKVAIFMPYWERAGNTAYCRVIKIAARDLYDIETIDESTLPALNRRMLDQNKPGLYKEVLEEKSHIRYCLWDQFWYDLPEKDVFFKQAARLDDVVYIRSNDDIQQLEKKYNINIRNLEALDDILEIRITNLKTSGLAAVKMGLAYDRTLDFVAVTHAEAALSMEKLLRNRFTDTDAKVIQDYMMFSLAQKCYWHNITIQIHTGLQEGNGNFIRHANPALLSPLIASNPQTRFDLLHGGYPYGGEMGALAKMFPNVYLDMAWLHVISPEFTRHYLAEWLDSVPINKIMGFGGDYLFVEGTYGHLQIAKTNIANVLANKVADGVFTMTEAKRYAAMMLYDNPDALFGGYI